MKDVAKEYRVSLSAISDIACKVRKEPSYIRELADKKYQRDKTRDLLVGHVEDILDKDLNINTVGMLKSHLK